MRGSMVAGRYRLDDRIASGGQGEVWRGFDTRLERPVAIKLLHSGLSGNERFRHRFHQEAKSVAALQAPGIVGLYDYGEDQTDDGIASYLVMELVNGPSLADLIRQQGRLPIRRAMAIIAETADALQAAHRVGLIHRDIKPANILISSEDHPKIVDFGIARARGEAGLTETGMVMGTVAYASPEQLCDDNLTGSSDIYSLGIVAHEALSGRQPFSSESPAAAIQAQLNQPPPPLPGDVPAPVSDVIRKALAKNPRERWTSAAEFAQACRDAVSGGGTTVLLASAAAAATQMMPRETAASGRAVPRRPEPPMPPPREPEPDEKSGKALPVLIALAVVAVLIALVVVFVATRGDNDDGAEPGDDETSTSAPSSQSDDEESSDDESSSDDETSSPDDPTSDEQTSSEPEQITVPDVKGQNLEDAIVTLNQSGFEDLEYSAIPPGNQEPCTVQSTQPGANKKVDEGTRVRVIYRGSPEECEPG